MIYDRVLGIASHVRAARLPRRVISTAHLIGCSLLPAGPCTAEAPPLAPSEFYISFVALPSPTSFFFILVHGHYAYQ